MSFIDWLSNFVEWLRNSFGVANTKSFSYLEHLSDQDGKCEAWLLFDDRASCPIAGVAALWYITHHASSSSDLLIICINIAQSRGEWLDRGEHHKITEEMKRQVEIKVSNELRTQKHITGTHIFLTCWISKKSDVERLVIRDGRSRTERFKRIECTSCYKVDLQGFSRAWVPGANDHAVKLCKAIVQKILRVKPGNEPSNTWDRLVKMLDGQGELQSNGKRTSWLSLLELFSQKHPIAKISAGHIIQPRNMVLKEPPED